MSFIRKNFKIFLLLIIAFVISSCESKFNEGLLDAPHSGSNIGGDTVYIQLSPVWNGFNNPQDIIIGKEPFIYIADTDNDRVMMMNLDGQILGTRSFKKPVALAEDYRLNLFVSAQFDTVVSGQPLTLNAVFKLNLFAANHVIADAPIKRILPATDADINNPLREYPSIAVFYDNSYVIGRRGPTNSVLIDPDNSLLYYVVKRLPDGTEKDSLTGRIAGLDPVGSGVPSANGFSSLISFDNHTYDLIAGLTGNTNFRVEWLHYVNTRDFTGYQNYISPSSSEIMIPNKFVQPEGVGMDDGGDIFVVDASKDSVYKFNSFGDQLLAFGGSDVFNKPAGVAFFDKTLYIADAGNNRILRFILSTDIR
jgi:NHL repeat